METLNDAVDKLCANIDGLREQVDWLMAECAHLNSENLRLTLERDNLRKFLSMVTQGRELQ